MRGVFLGAMLFCGFFCTAQPVQAILYAPGETMDPACAPTTIHCGIQNPVSAGLAGYVPYYAVDGSILAATSSITILANGNVGIGTLTPAHKLDVLGDIALSGRLVSKTLTIWAFGDVQVDTEDGAPGQEQLWLDVIDDVNTLKKDIAIMVGDIVDKGSATAPYYDWERYSTDLQKLDLPRHRIFHIAGNHDSNYNNPNGDPSGRGLDEYDQNFPKRNYYTLQGNVLTIFMSSEYRATAGYIPDPVFEWWKKLVMHNQDKVIVTVTHHPLYNTVASSTNEGYFIQNSDRFIAVLDQYKHSLWISGHNGHDLDGTNRILTKHDTLHMNVGLHLPGAASVPFDPKSRFLYFEDGSDQVTVRLRNHITGEWIPAREVSYTLDTKVELSESPIYDGRYQFDASHDLVRNGLHLFSELENGDGDGVADDIQRPFTITLNNMKNLNVQTGSGTGILFQLAGSPPGSEPVGTHNYGVGAAIDAVRESDTDTDYRAGLSFKVSGSGGYLDSLFEGLRITSQGNVGIGTSTPEYTLDVLGEIRVSTTTGNIGFISQYDGVDGRAYRMMSCFDCTSAGVGGFEVYDVTVGATRAYIQPDVNGWQTPSDLRLKENIRTLSVLDRLDTIRGTSYTLRGSSIAQIGVIAQEVKKAFPEAVSGSEEEGRFLGVSYDAIAAIALQGVKEVWGRVQHVVAWFSFDGARFNVQGSVCVDDVCMSKEQFKTLLESGGARSMPEFSPTLPDGETPPEPEEEQMEPAGPEEAEEEVVEPEEVVPERHEDDTFTDDTN